MKINVKKRIKNFVEIVEVKIIIKIIVMESFALGVGVKDIEM